MTTRKNISTILMMANLISEGFPCNEYEMLSKEDKALVDYLCKTKKIIQQFNNDKLFNNRTNDNKFYVC